MAGATESLGDFFYILLIEASSLGNKEMWTAGQKKMDKNVFTDVPKMVGSKVEEWRKKIQTFLDLEEY